MPENNAFGLPKEITETPEDPFADAPEVGAVAEPEPAVEAEAAVEEPAEPTPGADPLAPVEEPEPVEPALDEAETPAEPAGTPYEGRYSTKYQTVEAFEEAHRNALDLSQRQAERARQAEAQLMQANEYLRLAGEYFEQQQKQQQQPVAPAAAAQDPELLALAEQYGVDPEVMAATRALIAKEAEQQVAPLQQQMLEQQQAQALERAQAAAKSQIIAFKQAHEADLTEDVESGIVDVFNHFGLDATAAENYEIALEVAQNPSLGKVLRANPDWIYSADGLDYAREQASLRIVAPPTVSREAEVAAARKRATVESGSGGGAGPIEDDRPKDTYDLALEIASDERKKSVFGV